MFKMDDLPPAPSIPLKTFSIAVRWSLWVVLAAWLLFAVVWGALHLFIVPRIGELRPQLETRASQVLGVPVRIGGITAQSEGMIPSFELTDVRLFDPEGREALRLPKVLASLSPRSLWNLGFEQLYIDRLELNIRRSKEGKIFVAGLDFSKNQAAGNDAADWFFSQTEFAIHQGTVQWTDELLDVPTLALQQVNFVMRNKSRRHDFRFDATPPPEWGQRFSLMARFRQPLLSGHEGHWRDWDGQIYAAFDRIDVSQPGRYANPGSHMPQGRGALRAWVDVSRGQVTGATADVVLAQASVTLGPQLAPLALESMAGRLGGRMLPGGFEFSTQGLQFDTHDGMRWPGGNIRIMHLAGDARVSARGELQADKLDLAALSQIANRLPLDARAHAALLTYASRGLVERIQASWQGPMEAPTRFEVKGRVVQLEVASRPADRAGNTKGQRDRVGSPGVRGASIDFDLSQSGGRATVALQDGRVELPGVFEDPVLTFTQLSSDVQWKVDGARLSVQLPNMKFSNPDAQGEAQIKWQTSDAGQAQGRSGFPGVLDMHGSLSRAEGNRIHRYLPMSMDLPLREYLRDAIQGGKAAGVKFRVKGDLDDMPFADPKQGDFRISASVRDATYAYVPRSSQPAGALPWPALTQVTGDLVIDRATLQLKDVRAKLAGAQGLRITKAEALIPDLFHSPTVVVNAQAQGPLGELLGVVINGSPLGDLTGQALGKASGAGNAEYRFKLTLPVTALDKSAVQGSATLAGNDLQMTPDMPRMSRVRGVVSFSENGFAIAGGQARMLGGEVRVEGGSTPLSGVNAAGAGRSRGGPSAVIRAQGTVTAEGLRQARELGLIARMAQNASGSTAYTAVLGFRAGMPELSVSSSLQGLGLSLPAPLNKSADAVLPLRLETALIRDSLVPGPAGQVHLQDQVQLDIGRIASMVYVRDLSGLEAKVIRGGIGVGLAPGESVPAPADGVAANINMSHVDLDAWRAVLFPAAGSVGSEGGAGVAREAAAYLPNSMAVRARELTAGGRKLTNVVVGGSRDGLLWRANLDAHELNGYLEYRQPSGAGAGRLYARLARLSLAQASAKDVEALLEEQPVSIPALDIVVDDLELRGRKLGRVEIEAVNRGAGAVARDGGVREWRLNKFNMITPEAVLTATGNWAALNAQSPAASGPQRPRAQGDQRRTVMNFKLDIADAGELLNRLGMKDVIRKGKGKMEGQVAWVGSPLMLDYPSMGGAFNVNVETGQFLKADPGIAKLLGVLSLQSLPRRLTLDFRDVFSEGFAFDFFRGDIHIEQGIAITNNLQMKGVNAAVLMEGRADIARETQDLKVVVVPEINAGTASLIATWINPAVGLGSFLAQLFLRRPLIESATQEFHIDGPWADPRITKIGPKPEGKSEAAR